MVLSQVDEWYGGNRVAWAGSKMMESARVWYWNGGREHGYWCPVDLRGMFGVPHQTVPGAIDELERAGYVALAVDPAIGPPDDAPSEERFRAVGI